MNYRSYADLARVVTKKISLVPRDVDLVVAIPRSGCLPASIIGCTLNLSLIDLDGFLAGRVPQHGISRKLATGERSSFRHALIVDDSVLTGTSLEQVKARVQQAAPSCRVTYAAVFVTKESSSLVDLHFDICPFPRQFEWNVFHHEHLSRCCVDIDGVLCLDPDPAVNDDGPRYREFLLEAVPHILPSRPIRHLVTSRLEKWRPETESWLQSHGVRYERLSMLDLPTARERARTGAHGTHKARVYAADHGAKLFIESEQFQAEQIARLSGKPALSLETQTVAYPDALSLTALKSKSLVLRHSIFQRGLRYLRKRTALKLLSAREGP